MRVLVTGATGNVGREVVRALKARGIAARSGVRRPLDDSPEAVRFDFFERSTWDPAVRGVTGLFLIRPPAIARVTDTLNPFVDAARGAGVQHVVFLSVLGADTNRIVPHHRVEKHLAAGGADHTILRPGFFAQNFEDAYRADIVEADRVYVPAGGGAVSFVDLFDVGELAAEIFSKPAVHRACGYVLTGPEAVTFQDACARLSGVVGRTIRYEPASVSGYARHLRRRGLSWGQLAVQTILHVRLRSGRAASVDPTLERLLGRPPRKLDTYFARRAERFSPCSG